jgi:hypothetical protein
MIKFQGRVDNIRIIHLLSNLVSKAAQPSTVTGGYQWYWNRLGLKKVKIIKVIKSLTNTQESSTIYQTKT